MCHMLQTLDYTSCSSDQKNTYFLDFVQFFWNCSDNSRKKTNVLSTGLVLQKVPPQGLNNKFIEAEHSSTAGRKEAYLSSFSPLGTWLFVGIFI